MDTIKASELFINDHSNHWLITEKRIGTMIHCCSLYYQQFSPSHQNETHFTISEKTCTQASTQWRSIMYACSWRSHKALFWINTACGLCSGSSLPSLIKGWEHQAFLVLQTLVFAFGSSWIHRSSQGWLLRAPNPPISSHRKDKTACILVMTTRQLRRWLCQIWCSTTERSQQIM